MQTDLTREFVKTYKKSEVIFEENSPGNEMFVISSGKVRISSNESGQKVDLTVLGPGEFFGEMSLVDSALRSATATAAEENTRLVILDQSKFLYLVSQQPSFALTIMYAMCQRIRNQNELLSTKAMEKRITAGENDCHE